MFRFGLEKKVGALELIAYGPADGTSYFLASLAKDVLLTLLSLAVLLAFLLVAAALNNLILGPAFTVNLAMLFLLATAIYAYGMPRDTALASAAYGAGFGLFPIGWIVLNIIFLHQLTEPVAEGEPSRATHITGAGKRRIIA